MTSLASLLIRLLSVALVPLALLAGPSHTAAAVRETLDQVVAAVDGAAITRSDVEREYRFELLLNREIAKAGPDAATFQAVRNRLIDRILLRHEADAENMTADEPGTSPTELLNDIRKKFSSEEAFQSTLRSSGLDEPQVVARLRDHDRILRLIDRRLRPSARVEDAEIEAYYQQTFVPEFARRASGAPPPLSTVESQIREILTQKKIDQLLEAWLENLKSSHRVSVHIF